VYINSSLSPTAFSGGLLLGLFAHELRALASQATPNPNRLSGDRKQARMFASFTQYLTDHSFQLFVLTLVCGFALIPLGFIGIIPFGTMAILVILNPND
jgi:hypothetical protein